MPPTPTPNQVRILRTLVDIDVFTRTRALAEVSGATYMATYKFLRILLDHRMVDHTVKPSDVTSRTPHHLYVLNSRGRTWAAAVLKEAVV